MFRSTLSRLVLSSSLLAFLAGCQGGGVETGGLRVSIEATPEAGAVPLQVSLKATVNGEEPPADAEYDWSLGDGTTSTDANPVHLFEELGTYEVTLTLEVNGKKGAATREIEVLEVGPGIDLAVEGIEATPSSVNPGAPITVKVTFRNRGEEGTDSPIVNRVYITQTADGFDPFGAQPDGIVNLAGIGGDTTTDKSTTIDIDDQAADGEYFVWILSDAGGALDETNEDNNVTRSTNALSVTSAVLPIDLVASEPTITSTTFSPDTPVTLETTLSNAGTADAGAFEAKVVLSPDPEIDANDTVISTITVGGLTAGEDAPQSLEISVPATVINRPWYLGIVVDTGSTVGETDESNNVVAYDDGLVTTAGGSGCTEDANEPNDTEAQATVVATGMLPALKVCGATTDWFSLDLGAGDRLDASIAFQNVNGNLSLAVFREGETSPIMTSDGAGNSEAVDGGIALTAGTYLVQVTLGAGGGNEYALTTSVEDNGGAGIDLMATAISFGDDMGPYAPGEAHPAGVTVYNFGDMATSAAFDVALWLSEDETLDGSDLALGTMTVTSLGSGAMSTDSRTVTLPMTLAEGYYNLVAVADSGASNTETVESNNVLTKRIGVGVGCLDDLLEPNQTTGTASPIGNGTFDYQVCSGDHDYFKIETGAGGTIDVTIEFPGGISPQDLDLYLVDAAGNYPAECNASGNDCYAGSSSPMENVHMTSTLGGTYYVQVYSYNSSEAPYSITISGSTGAIADLSPHSIVATPAELSAGEDVQVDGRIKNNSTEPLSTGFEWSIRISSDMNIDGADMTLGTFPETALAANENRAISEKVTVPDTLSGGTYWIGVIADPTGMVEEDSEANNIAISGSPVTVAALCDDDSYEENDTLGSASQIAIGGTIPALVACSNDPDHYEITPSADGTLTLHVDFAHANGDLDLRLFQGLDVVASSISTDDDEDLQFEVTGGTPYVIKVYGFENATNTYTLTTSVAP